MARAPPQFVEEWEELYAECVERADEADCDDYYGDETYDDWFWKD